MMLKIFGLLCASALKKITVVSVARVLFPVSFIVSTSLFPPYDFPYASQPTVLSLPASHIPGTIKRADTLQAEAYSLPPMAAFQRVDSIKPIHYENSVSFNETATTVTYQPETVTYLPEEDSQPDTPQESLVLLPTASSHPAVPEVTEEAVAQDTAQSGTAILLGAPYPLASYDTTGQPLEGGTSSAGGSEPGTEMPDTTAPIIEIISPANNSYTKATPIVAQYTVDGAGMTKNVDLAEGANTITITETDASGNAGSASVNVTLDTIAPLIEITYPADGSVLTSTPVTVIYTVDGVEKTKDAALTEGANTITIRETDPAGNTGQVILNVTLNTPDTTPPEIVIIYPQEGAVLTSSPVTVIYTVDGVEKTKDAALTEGANTITIRETDPAGNTGSASANVTLNTSPSQTPWKTNQNGYITMNQTYTNTSMGYVFTPLKNGQITKLGGYFEGTFTVTLWQTSTHQSLAQANVTSNNGWVYVPIASVSVLAEQSYTVSVYINSTGGSARTGTSSFPRTYQDIRINKGVRSQAAGMPTGATPHQIAGQVDVEYLPSGDDTAPPTGSISINNDAASTITNSVTLNLSATDSGSGMDAGSQMQFSNDGITYSVPEAYAATKAWTLTSGDGTKTVSAKFKDVAGNWSSTYSDTITLDTIAPLVEITYPSEGAVLISSPVTVRYTVDGVETQKDVALLEGANTITITEADAAGNIGSASITVTLYIASPTTVDPYVDDALSGSNRNLIRNPSFEDDGSVVWGNSEGWCYSAAFPPGVTYSDPLLNPQRSQSSASSGTTSYKVNFDGTPGPEGEARHNFYHVSQLVDNIKENAKYEVTYSMKTESMSRGSGIECSFFDSSGNLCGYKGILLTPTGSNGWRRYSCVINTSPGTVRMRLTLRVIGVVGGIGGTTWWDDIAIKPVPKITDIAIDGGVMNIAGENFGADPGVSGLSKNYNYILDVDTGAKIYANSWADGAIQFNPIDSAHKVRVFSGGLGSNIGYIGMNHAPSTITLANSSIGIEFSVAKNFSLAQITDRIRGRDFLNSYADTPLYEIEYKDSLYVADYSGRRKVTNLEADGAYYKYVTPDKLELYFIHDKLGLTIKAAVTLDDSSPGLSNWNISVENNGVAIIKSVTYPYLLLKSQLGADPADDNIVFPTVSGYCYKGFKDSNNGEGAIGIYPQWVNMQFMAYYDNEMPSGMFIGTFDPNGNKKSFGFVRVKSSPGWPTEKDAIIVPWKYFSQNETVGNDFEMDYDLTIKLFSGADGDPVDWRDAADIYKEWAAEQPWSKKIIERDDVPSAVMDADSHIMHFDMDMCVQDWPSEIIGKNVAALTSDPYGIPKNNLHLIFDPGGAWGIKDRAGNRFQWSGIDYYQPDTDGGTIPFDPSSDDILTNTINDLRYKYNADTYLMLSGFRWDISEKGGDGVPDIIEAIIRKYLDQFPDKTQAVDTDYDSIDDDVEKAVWGNITATSSFRYDSNNDSIPDLEEYLINRNLDRINMGSTDGDGIPDCVEIEIYGNLDYSFWPYGLASDLDSPDNLRFSDEADFNAKGKPYVIRNEDGTYSYRTSVGVDPAAYNHTRESAFICIGADGNDIMNEVVVDNIERGIRRGATIMSLDQIIGGAAEGCWDESHGHPLGNGGWTVSRLNTLLQRIKDRVGQMGKTGKFGLSVEQESEPGLQGLQIQFQRQQSFIEGCYPAPAYKKVCIFNYVYHGTYIGLDDGGQSPFVGQWNPNEVDLGRWSAAIGYITGNVSGYGHSPMSIGTGQFNFYKKILKNYNKIVRYSEILHPPVIRADGNIIPEKSYSFNRSPDNIPKTAFYDPILYNVFKRPDGKLHYLFINIDGVPHNNVNFDVQYSFLPPGAGIDVEEVRNGAMSQLTGVKEGDRITFNIESGDIVEFIVKVFGSEVLNGRVTNSSEDPVKGVVIKLIQAGTVKALTLSDEDGRYSFNNMGSDILSGGYTLICEKDGYGTHSDAVVLSGGTVSRDITIADIKPPSVPENLIAVALEGAVSLTWTASTDNTAVTAYRVYRGSSPEAIPETDQTTYTDSSIQPDTDYSYTVSAIDAAGNESGQSDPVAIRLEPLSDTVPTVIEIISPLNGAILTSTPVTVIYTVDGIDMTRDVDLVEGANTITITETDASGNSGNAAINVTLNTSPS